MADSVQCLDGQLNKWILFNSKNTDLYFRVEYSTKKKKRLYDFLSSLTNWFSEQCPFPLFMLWVSLTNFTLCCHNFQVHWTSLLSEGPAEMTLIPKAKISMVREKSYYFHLHGECQAIFWKQEPKPTLLFSIIVLFIYTVPNHTGL